MIRRALLPGLLTLGLAGCLSVDEDPVFFDVEIQPVDGSGFDTATGWTVTLDQAVVALGPVYLRDEGLRYRSGSHGGDADAIDETLAAEFIQQVAFDLTRERARVGEGRGSVRNVDVLEPRLEPPSPWISGDASVLGDAPAVVRGTASRDGQVLEFVGELPHMEHDEQDEQDEQAHAGEVEVEAFELSDGGTLTIVVDPSAWFADAQFDQLTQTDPDGRRVITPASQVGVAWEQARVDAFGLVWAPGDSDGDGSGGP